MGKTRKCRLTENEIAVHEMAVKLRKKTDEQLVDIFQDIFNQGYQNGLDKNKLPEGEIFVSDKAKSDFLDTIKNMPGIGKVIYQKIENMVMQNVA